MFDASFVAPHAMLLRRTDRVLDWDVLRLFSELIRYKNAAIVGDRSVAQFAADQAATRRQILSLEAQLTMMASEAEQRGSNATPCSTVSPVDAMRIMGETVAGLRSQVDTELARQRAALEKVQSDLEKLTSQASIRSQVDIELGRQRAALEKVQGDLEQFTSQNAVLVEGLEKSVSTGERMQREAGHRIDQYASESAAFRRTFSADIEERFSAIHGKLQVIHRKVSEIEVGAQETHIQLTEILQSRIWESLKWVGGVILKFKPGQR
jgi:hypothetical protein